MAINFDLNDLQAFRAVAELGNFSRAAQAVHISQPAFSRRIDKLEQALGVQLLERSTRRVSLTAVGRDFARSVQVLLDQLDTTLMSLHGVAASHLGAVTVACVPSTLYYYVAQVVQRFCSSYPRIHVKVLDASANEVLSAVARGEADFGLNFIGQQEPQIEFRPLLEERFVAACRRDHPLAKKRRVSWADLAEQPLITVAQSSGNRRLIEQALAGRNIKLRSVCESQHVSTMIGLVEAGLGVATVPALAMPGKDHPFLVSVPLDGPVVQRHLGLIKRRGHALTPGARPLYDFFTELPVPGTKGQLLRPKSRT